ncbi:hypothetical protein [uncultured Rothia sp.]|uniref:hypothetical protein n=1 Tax=uncultured Rothia sp. TaxID=316088 RepID=UPI0032164E04
MILEEGKNIWTPEEAFEVLKGAYKSYETFKNKMYSKKIPRHGGPGTGKLVHFTREDMIEIYEMGAVRPEKSEEKKTKPFEPVPELPAAFRQTSRSRARHRGSA